ncbi:MAG: GMC family oxidoreductase [Chitinophagales bacterium]|nr:GMC family oxidoreductase [Chitinophagales bacterium]
MKNYNRRKFIKATAMAGTGALISSCMKTEDFNAYEKYDALVIGSGFGGSVSTYRLAKAGLKVGLIEKGRSWINHDFTSSRNINEKTTWLSNICNLPFVNIKVPISKYAGIVEYHDFQNMNIYNATGVGGGSLVFGATYVQPHEEVFNLVFPTEVSFEEMSQIYYPRVDSMINISQVPEHIYQSEYYTHARAFNQQALNANMTVRRLPASYDWSIIDKELNGEIPKEFLYGDGGFGTRNGAKDSLDKNYIPDAVATGNATLHTLHEVQYINRRDNGYVITVHRIDEQGNILEKKQMWCKYLFLCAGAPNTLKLLLKAKTLGHLPNLNDRIGKGFGTNGKTFFKRTIQESTGAYTAYVPANGVLDIDNPVVPIFIECVPQPINVFLPGIPQKSLFHVAFGFSSYRGEFKYNAFLDKLEMNWSQDGIQESINAASNWAERVNEANPGSYVDTDLFPNKYLKDTSYHPLGGCVIGDATDYYGRLLEYPNLYVNDATLIPGVLGANPAYTVAALAERNIEHIINNDINL